MGTSSMAMSATTATDSAAAATTSAMHMSGMDMGIGGGGDCQISMLWNWYTVDACFLSSTWHITSRGMFAGSCIRVILLVMALEFLRRLGKEYDRLLVRNHQAASVGQSAAGASIASDRSLKNRNAQVSATRGISDGDTGGFRPSMFEQAVRALLHMVQFAVAYITMLLAMYYNGYIIICIFIGAFLGAFVFQWEVLGV
ncbi:hypothetical protein KVR01_012232 [Diaporthe batatas]|uniref:uncharacterized protein n=1 Tax=Diaporthe batatas TaxID=748121 RepID=UPI001D047835|nr:uncharacterized protein KVR01_012232 [Diaporthe batatas]KAG8157960.1 hypothetical protein KVR01_012232 [Diaporthe batatas]